MPDAAGSPGALDDLWANRGRTRPAADAVYATLRDAIVAGHLPAGVRLLEEQLARQFEVSRTPVREAIFRLQTEHFAERLDGRGLVVRGIPEFEVLEVYAVRAALDGLAAGLAAAVGQPADHARLRWLNDRLADRSAQHDLATASEMNIQFHEALSEAAHNGMLLHFVRQVHDRVRRFGATTLSVSGRATAAVSEHAAIVDAIEAGEADRAELLARQHISRSREARLGTLRRGAE